MHTWTEEPAMRSPFYMDRLRPEDRKNVRRLMVRVLAFYLSLALLVVTGSTLKARFLNSQTAEVAKAMPVSR